jgi:mannose-6-phosphate isomerase-like protein (cupin superfamily)
MIDSPVKAETFRVRTPLLSKGSKGTVLAESDLMQVRIKCYAQGGENGLHTHTGEDHTFVILQGKARFHDENGNVTELGRNGGILLPRGAYYRFESCGDEQLVLLRVSAKTKATTNDRLGRDGRALPGESVDNHHVDPVIIEGAFYE